MYRIVYVTISQLINSHNEYARLDAMGTFKKTGEIKIIYIYTLWLSNRITSNLLLSNFR